MPLRPDVPLASRAALEAWFQDKASDPQVFARLQSDFAGTVEELIGMRPPPSLNIQLHVEQPGQTVMVKRFDGSIGGTAGQAMTPLPSGGATASTSSASKVATSSGDHAAVLPAADVTILNETSSLKFLVLRPPSVLKSPAAADKT